MSNLNKLKIELLPLYMLDKDKKWFIYSYVQVLMPDISKYTKKELEGLEE